MRVASEIAAPAGSFDAGYYAFQGGADAVYLGLKDFSARSSALNFSIEELRKLKTIASESNKKIYVALNTVIAESEIERVSELLCSLDIIKPDGIIVQDIGLANIIKKHFPKLNLHASTQMAVHNAAGVGILQDLGFKRVVLSRELSFDKIYKIRLLYPKMELEVFVHGALCYSFSGLCLASGILLGRSGNRGQCAQVCRNYYRMKGTDGYYFSCCDLALYEEVLKLREIGVNSFKIEGRMKPPEYVFNVSRLYRAILDGLPAEELKTLAEICFLRKPTTGFLNDPKGESIIASDFPGHRGILIGKALETQKDSFLFKPQYSISRKDGLMFFIGGDTMRPHIFSAELNNRNIAKKGEIVEVISKVVPARGQEIFLVSSRNLDLKTVSEGSFKPWKKPLDFSVAVSAGGVEINSEYGMFGYEAHIEQSRNKADIHAILKNIFSQSGESFFTAGNIDFENKTSLGDDEIFIQPSILKKIKNGFYDWLEIKKNDQLIKTVSSIISDNLTIKHSEKGGIQNSVVISLVPVVFDEEVYIKELEKAIDDAQGKQVLIGINNISHISIARRLMSFENVKFFLDIYAYAANRYMIDFYSRELGGKLSFAIFWIEGEEKDFAVLEQKYPLMKADKNREIPLFYALSCFQRNNFGGGKCPENCPKNFSYELTNGQKKFRVEVKNCVTIMKSL